MKRYIFHAMASGPRAIERMLRVFPKGRLDERLDPERFTARELLAHLADFEQVHLDRIRVARSRPGYQIVAEDPTKRAEEHHYGEKDPFHEAEVFESRRLVTLDFLKTLTDEELHNPVVTPDGTEINLMEYALAMVAHDMYHIEQLSMYLANEAATIS